MSQLWQDLAGQVPWAWVLLPGVALSGWVACSVGLRWFRRASRRADAELGSWIVKHLGRPLRLVVPAFLFRLALPLAALSPGRFDALRQVVAIVLIFGVGWLLVALTAVANEFLDQRFLLDVRDNLMARRVHTKFRVLRRILVIMIGIVTTGAMLMTFPAVRHLGAGLLASAGIVGIVLGIAARPTVEMLIAGAQLALTEPIRLDDVLIVEGEWGRVEEIAATYVVVRIWDERRLIVPVNYFLTQPFQNWTRVTADLLGSVTLEVDYTTPVDEVRAEAGRIVEVSPLWDRKTWNLQVVDLGDRTMKLRVLASAADAPTAWDLRCEIREKLVTYLQRSHPTALPRLRAELESRVT